MPIDPETVKSQSFARWQYHLLFPLVVFARWRLWKTAVNVRCLHLVVEIIMRLIFDMLESTQ